MPHSLLARDRVYARHGGPLQPVQRKPRRNTGRLQGHHGGGTETRREERYQRVLDHEPRHHQGHEFLHHLPELGGHGEILVRKDGAALRLQDGRVRGHRILAHAVHVRLLTALQNVSQVLQFPAQDSSQDCPRQQGVLRRVSRSVSQDYQCLMHPVERE